MSVKPDMWRELLENSDKRVEMMCHELQERMCEREEALVIKFASDEALRRLKWSIEAEIESRLNAGKGV